MLCQDGKVVEAPFRIGVENFVTAQRLQTGVFLGFHSDLRLSARNDSKSKRFCRGGEIPSGSRAQVVVHSSEDEARAITPAPLFSLVESSNPCANCFRLRVVVEDFVTHLAAPAGLLVATEWQGCVEDVVAVNPYRTGSQLLRSTVRFTDVLCPNTSS